MHMCLVLNNKCYSYVFCFRILAPGQTLQKGSKINIRTLCMPNFKIDQAFRLRSCMLK